MAVQPSQKRRNQSGRDVISAPTWRQPTCRALTAMAAVAAAAVRPHSLLCSGSFTRPARPSLHRFSTQFSPSFIHLASSASCHLPACVSSSPPTRRNSATATAVDLVPSPFFARLAPVGPSIFDQVWPIFHSFPVNRRCLGRRTRLQLGLASTKWLDTFLLLADRIAHANSYLAGTLFSGVLSGMVCLH